MLVSHILKEKGRDVVAIPPYATLYEAARILAINRIGALVVLTRDGGFDGMISERDIVHALAEKGEGALSLSVTARMVRDIASCEETDTIEEIMDTMTWCHFRHLPVVKSGFVVGVVSIGDVVKTRITETIREAQALKHYIATG